MGNRIYCHHLLHINYTTYDLQHKFDSINPCTDHWTSCYLLGIFHTNVMYTGPRSKDFQSCQIEFLWDRLSGWQKHTLDTVRFLPMRDKDAFGFIDPTDVLRSCHVIPSFADSQLHTGDHVAMSHHTGDSGDWKCYYINQRVQA
ncbi:hypothetical protein BDN67DRAFT_992418 [Paxillus ammoniavirescens]|nr:hypothetical protein BDN67DRAFT_992418 [Paxillus ammoniavirescens]